MAEKQKKIPKGKTQQRGSASDDNSNPTMTCDTKLPSMKTASDVISRILWDDSIPKEKISVGYLDRFDGIAEKPFTSVDWNDPAVIDNHHTLALPVHRIQYFKYRDEKIWDKRTRKDMVFGSTGFHLSIHGFMAVVDQEKKGFYDEAIVKHVGDSNIGYEDSDGENEDEFRNSNRANFFVTARIENENTVKNLKKVSDHIWSKDKLLQECCILPEIYHFTLCILRLKHPGAIADAIDAMHSVALENLPLRINLEGLGNFRHRELFARIDYNDELYKLHKCLTDALGSSVITDDFSFVPHVTIAKLSRPVSRLRNSNHIEQYLYSKFEDENFGSEEISELYLCKMNEAYSEDLFYDCAGHVSLLN